MGITSATNKRRRTPLIDNNLIRNVIFTTLLTVKYNKEAKDKTAELGINLIFLPPYSPNLNIIERLWKYTRRHVLAGKYFDSSTKFHDALRHFFEVDYVNHKSNLSSLLTLKFQCIQKCTFTLCVNYK